MIGASDIFNHFFIIYEYELPAFYIHSVGFSFNTEHCSLLQMKSVDE